MRLVIVCLIGALAALQTVAVPKFTLQPTPRTNSVSIGAVISNRVAATSTNGAVTYQWRFGGVDIGGKTNASFTLTNAQVSMAGLYTAIASDADGSVESASWVIDVDPSFLKVMVSPPLALPSSGGVGWADYNNDGRLDLVVSSSPLSLYENKSGTNWTKVNSPYLAGLSYKADVAWADFDNDGWVDLLATSYGQVALARNTNGIFRGATTVGLPASGNFFGAAWADYDRDGFVDLLLTSGFNRAVNSLYRNTNGMFRAVTTNIVVKDTPEFSQGPAWCDYDNDGWPDLFIANGRDYNGGGGGRPSFLYHNLGAGKFEKIKNVITTNLFGLACGVWGDFNNDGLMDLFACGYAIGSAPQRRLLFQNLGNGEFARVLDSSGLTQDSGYDQGAAAIDYDNDGWLDIFIASGGPNAFNDALYHNNGDGTFTRVTRGSLVNDMGEGAGCAWGDFNGDGFLDLFVSNFQNQFPEKNGFYINQGNSNHWLEVKCIGRISNRSGIGAKVHVLATVGGRKLWQKREISSSGGYMSATTLEAHFGLGDAVAVEKIRVEWPSGIVQEIDGAEVDHVLKIEEPLRLHISGGAEGFMVTSDGRGDALIESSNDLKQWEPCGIRSDTNRVFTVTNSVEISRYFRLR